MISSAGRFGFRLLQDKHLRRFISFLCAWLDFLTNAWIDWSDFLVAHWGN
jgi:hypothetical protein